MERYDGSHVLPLFLSKKELARFCVEREVKTGKGKAGMKATYL